MSPIPRPFENMDVMKNKTKKKRPQRIFPGIEEGDERISLKRRIKKNIAVRMSGILFVRISQIEMITRYKRQSASKITYKQCSFISVKYRKKKCFVKYFLKIISIFFLFFILLFRILLYNFNRRYNKAAG